MMRSIFLRQVLNQSIFYGSRRLQSINKESRDFVVIFPENLTDTPETNEILRLPKHDEPEIDFSKLSLETAFKGANQRLCSFKDFISLIEDESTPSDMAMSELFKKIEEHLYPLDSSISLLSALVMMDRQKYGYKEIYELFQRYHTNRNQRLSGKFMTIIENYMSQNDPKISDADRMMLQLYVPVKALLRSKFRQFEESTIKSNLVQLDDGSRRFQANILASDQQFSHTIDDPDVLGHISTEIDDFRDSHHRERTPLIVTATSYPRFMQICPDRFIRQFLWSNFRKRCSPKSLPAYNNQSVINFIRSSKRNIAESKGYRNHFEYKTRNAMARSKTQVLDNLKMLNEINQDRLSEQLQELNDFAADNSFEDPNQLGIQEYDVDFWTNKYSHDILIGKSESELKAYFPHNVVLNGVRAFFKNYFGLNIKLVDQKNYKELPFNEYTQLMQVYKNGQLLGNLIYHPCDSGESLRQPETVLLRLRNRSNSFGCVPLIMLKSYVKRSVVTKKINLRVMEIIEIFNSFAAALQRLLYNHDYYELNIEGCIEPDANKLFPILSTGYVLNDHRVIQSCSDRGNSKTIDSELALRIINAVGYFRPFRLWQDLYKAHLDIEVNTTQEDIKRLARETYSIYSPFVRDPNDYDYCTMDDMLIGPEDGIKYSSLWSKQLANHCLTHVLAPKTENMGPTTVVDHSKVLAFNTRLMDQLSSPEYCNTDSRLLELTGQRFDPAKISASNFI